MKNKVVATVVIPVVSTAEKDGGDRGGRGAVVHREEETMCLRGREIECYVFF